MEVEKIEINALDSRYDTHGQNSSLLQVRNALNKIVAKDYGHPYTNGSASKILPSLPGLNIEGVGPVPLPVTDKIVDMIKEVPAIIDSHIPNIFEVDASHLQLTNPEWSRGLKELASIVANDLGVDPSTVRTKLDKLLIYEKDGSVEKRFDAEKKNGTFAALSVQLPSIFTGGCFTVSHGEKPKTYASDVEDSMYACNFVAHYSDCEYEIEPISSGHRMVLLYSLCYTGSESSKPRAIDLGTTKNLREHMENLPPDKTIFCIPLKHEYSHSTLAKGGVAALKKEDMMKKEAIANADPQNNWKFVIAKISRIDTEYGTLNSFDDFNLEDTEEGVPTFETLYNENGSNSKSHESWISHQLDLECQDMVFGDDLWTESYGLDMDRRISGLVEHTREHSGCILVVFSKDSSFERICKTSLSDGVSKVVRDHTLMPRMMVFLARENSQNSTSRSLTDSEKERCVLSSEECFQLLSIHNFEGKCNKEVKDVLSIILSLHDAKEVPVSKLSGLLMYYIKQFGGEDWNDATGPIRDFLSKLYKADFHMGPITLLEQLDTLLQIMKLVKDDTPFVAIEEITKTFCKETVSTKELSGISNKEKLPILISATADKIIDLSQQHGWAAAKNAAHACFERFRKLSGNFNPKILGERVKALQMIREKVPSSNFDSYFIKVAEEFVLSLEYINGSWRWLQARHFCRPPEVPDLLSPTTTAIFLEYGNSAQLERVEKWGPGAKKYLLESLIDALHKIFEPSLEGPKALYIEALERHDSRNKERAEKDRIRGLKWDIKKLMNSKKNGPPVFSWSMPQKLRISGYEALYNFLESNEVGPKKFPVHAFQGALGRRDGDDISNDYNAIIELKRGIGSQSGNGTNDFYVMTKTKALYESRLRNYHIGLKNLETYKLQLLYLESKSTATSNTDLSSTGESQMIGHNSTTDSQDISRKRPRSTIS